MKKVKLAIMSTAILLSVGGAFATGLHFDCRFSPQYHLSGGVFLPAGQLGVDYLCQNNPGICTYIKVGTNYQACQMGVYSALPQ